MSNSSSRQYSNDSNQKYVFNRRNDSYQSFNCKNPYLVNQQLKTSKSQIKSMSTLPSKNYIENTPKKPGYLFDINKNMKILSPQLKPSFLQKKSLLNRKKGSYYNNLWKQQLQNHQINNTINQKDSKRIVIQQLEQENMKLKSQLLDCELRERQNVEKINNLQKLCLKLQNILSNQKTFKKEQDEFLTVLKSTFKDCFGITSYKKIWSKQKQILKDWMQFTINQSKTKLKQEQQQNELNLQHHQHHHRKSSQQSNNHQIKINIRQTDDHKKSKNKRTKIRIQQHNPQLQSYQSI